MHVSFNKHNYTSHEKNYQEKFRTNSEIFNFIALCEKIFGLSANLKQKGANRVFQIILREVLLRADGCSHQLGNNYIATSAGVVIRQVQRITKNLAAHGIITIIPHPYKGRNAYCISQNFKINEIKQALKHLIPALDDTWLQAYKNISAKNKQIISEESEQHELNLEVKRLERAAQSSRLNRWSLSNMELEQNIPPFLDDLQKMSPFSKMNNITNLRETDDGVMLDEPDWLIAAGTPIVSDIVSVLKINNQKQRATTALPHSQNIFLKNDRPQYQQQVSSLKHETLYTKTILAIADELKSIRPTIWGQIQLIRFTEAAILHADYVLLNSKKVIDNPWTYFIGICKKYSEENNLEVKWSLSVNLAKQYSMPATGPFIDESFKPNKPAAVKKSYGKPQEGVAVDEVVHRKRIIAENKKRAEKTVVISEREKLQGPLDAMLKQVELSPNMRFIFQCSIDDYRKQLQALDEAEKTVDKGLLEVLSDKNSVENIMSKTQNPSQFTPSTRLDDNLGREIKHSSPLTSGDDIGFKPIAQSLIKFKPTNSNGCVPAIVDVHDNNDTDSADDYGFDMDPFGDRQVEPYHWSMHAKEHISWFTENLSKLPDDYDKTYILIKQTLSSTPSLQAERIVVEVISNLKRILDEEGNQERAAR